MDIKKSVVRAVRSDMFVPMSALVGACIGGAATIIAVKAMDKAVWGMVPRMLQFAVGYGGAAIGREAAIVAATIAQTIVATTIAQTMGEDELLEELRKAEERYVAAAPS